MGKREASVQCGGVPARATAPAGVECGGARQLCIREGATPSVDLWAMIVTRITQPSFPASQRPLTLAGTRWNALSPSLSL